MTTLETVIATLSASAALAGAMQPYSGPYSSGACGPERRRHSGRPNVPRRNEVRRRSLLSRSGWRNCRLS